MDLLDQRTIGITILFLLGMLIAIKRFATGSIFDRPRGNLLVQSANIFNLISLFLVNPLAAILLITRRLAAIDPTHMTLDEPRIGIVLEILGLFLYGTGFFLMAWALVTLRHNYQLGGCAPRPEDKLVVRGPYWLIRHPMYTAALGISFGLGCLIQSWICFGLFCIYLALIILIIPLEECELLQAYGEQYSAYQQETKGLIPLVY